MSSQNKKESHCPVLYQIFFSSQSTLGTTITIEIFIIGQTDHASLRSLKTIRMIFNFNPAGTVSAECQDANKGQLKMTNHFYFRYEVIISY